MSILFAGSEFNDFIPVGSGLTITTSATHIATAYSRSGLFLSTLATGYYRADFTGAADIWFSCNMGIASTTVAAGQSGIQMLTSASVPIWRITGNSSSGIKLQYWNGSSYTDVSGGSINLSVNTRYLLVVRYRKGASGGLDFYINGTLVGSYSGDTSALGDGAQIRLGCIPSAFNGNFYSEVIVATVPLIGARLAALTPSGAGTYSDWTGAYTDISESTPNDATLIYSDTAGDKATYATGNVPSGTGLSILGVVQSFRTRKNTTGPAHVKALNVQSGVDYAGSDLAPRTDYAFGPLQQIWGVNPATGALWTESEVNAAEFGVESVA